MRTSIATFCILIFTACGKSDGGGGSLAPLDHPIVGTWGPRNSIMVTFNSDRTLKETRDFSFFNCQITANYTFDLTGSTITSVYTGLTYNDTANCAAACTDIGNMTCEALRPYMMFNFTDGSTDFSISGTVLTINGLLTFDRN